MISTPSGAASPPADTVVNADALKGAAAIDALKGTDEGGRRSDATGVGGGAGGKAGDAASAASDVAGDTTRGNDGATDLLRSVALLPPSAQPPRLASAAANNETDAEGFPLGSISGVETHLATSADAPGALPPASGAAKKTGSVCVSMDAVLGRGLLK